MLTAIHEFKMCRTVSRHTMGTPLEDIAFLARSKSRVAILQALRGQSLDRRALETETGIPRSTLGRALGDLEEQGWVEQEDRTYRTTTAGTLVLDRFVPLLETMGGLRTLDGAVDLLPLDDMGVEVRQLRDATVVTPTELQPTEPYDYHLEVLRAVDRLAVVARTAPPPVVATVHDEITAGRLDATFVLDESYLETLSTDDDIRAKWAEIADRPASIHRHHGPIPYMLAVLDETVHLWPCDENGDTWGLLEIENAAVRTWAEETISEYREEARQMEPPLGL